MSPWKGRLRPRLRRHSRWAPDPRPIWQISFSTKNLENHLTMLTCCWIWKHIWQHWETIFWMKMITHYWEWDFWRKFKFPDSCDNIKSLECLVLLTSPLFGCCSTLSGFSSVHNNFKFQCSAFVTGHQISFHWISIWDVFDFDMKAFLEYFLHSLTSVKLNGSWCIL